MKTIAPTGITMMGRCDVQTSRCVARELAPITAVFETPKRVQVNVCSPCLEEQIRAGQWRVEGARVRTRADVGVYDKRGYIQAVFEIKKSPYHDKLPPTAWATKIRDQLTEYHAFPRAALLLLIAFPRFLFCWHRDDREPQMIVDLGNLVLQFLCNDNKSEHANMEQAVARWLAALAVNPAVAGDSYPFFEKTGLLDVIKQGSILTEVSQQVLH